MSYVNDVRTVAADRPIRLVLLASLVNTFGTGLYSATYVIVGLDHGAAGGSLTAALSFGALIALFCAPLGAWAAERFGSRNLCIAINLARAAANGLLVVAGPWWFVAVVLWLAVIDRFAFPASQSVLASVAARGDKSLVLSIRQLTQTLGMGLGAVTAAVVQLLIPREMLGVLILVNAATFLINAWLFARLPVETGPPRTHHLPWHAGWPPPTFLLFLGLSAAVDCVGMALEFALPLYAFEHEPSLIRWVGTANAVEAITSVAVTALIGRIMNEQRIVIGVCAGVCLSVVACSLLAAATLANTAVLTAILVFAILVGTGATILAFAVYFAVIQLAPEETRERYMAAYGMSGSLRRIVAPGILALCVVTGGWAILGAIVLIAGVSMAVCLVRILPHGTSTGAAS